MVIHSNHANLAAMQPQAIDEGQRRELCRGLLGVPELVRALELVRAAALPQAYLAAGAIRNTYWALKHGISPSLTDADLDLVYFDPSCPRERDRAIEQDLGARMPSMSWEVNNQAHVHTWYEAYCGVSLRPLGNCVAGIALWPETATCIGARLDEQGELDIVSPFGLSDLLEMRWRANPACPDRAAFERRTIEKRIAQRWPLLQIVCLILDDSA